MNISDLKNQITTLISQSITVKQSLLNNQLLISQIEIVTNIIVDAYNNGNKVLIAGNGGSAADAQHMAAELVGRFYLERVPLPAIALTVDSSALTAIGNDYGFEHIFARQLEAHGKKGDIYIAISTSGNSNNILSSLNSCKKMGLTSVGLVGAKMCAMDQSCDHIIKVDSTITPRIQEAHLLIEHIICQLVESKLVASQNNTI